MKLNPIGSNMTEIESGDYTVLFSYQTPVAYHKAGEGFAKTNKHWSATTTRHINKWLEYHGYNKERGDKLREFDQQLFDGLV